MHRQLKPMTDLNCHIKKQRRLKNLYCNIGIENVTGKTCLILKL